MRKWLKRHWILCVLTVIVAFGGCSFGALQYTHNPRFCLSCHVMQPYYDAWASSSHNKVSCVECHYPPGLRYELQGKLDALNQVVAYWTGSYDTKFYAEIDDASCMRQGCHTTRLIEGPITYKRGISFDHASHYGKPVRGIQLRCTSCHSQIVQGSHMAVTDFTCFLCHFRGRTSLSQPQSQQFCEECHSFPSETLQVGGMSYNHKDFVDRKVLCQRCHLDVVQGKGEVEDRACLQCHADPEQLAKIGDVEQVHLNHVTRHKVECFNCHANIVHKLPEPGAKPLFSCELCHSDTHTGPQELYAGNGARGVPDSPSPMFLAGVDCIGCHLDQTQKEADFAFKGYIMRPSVKGCIDCHGDIGQDYFNRWKSSLDDALAQTGPIVARAQAAAKGRTGLAADTVQLVDDAAYNYDLIKYGHGMHNPYYALLALQKARENAQAALQKMGR